MKTDASAAGSGKVRHIDIAFLYVQNFAVGKTLDFVCQNTGTSCRHVHEGSHPGHNPQSGFATVAQMHQRSCTVGDGGR